MTTIKTELTLLEVCEELVNEIIIAYTCGSDPRYIGFGKDGHIDYGYAKNELEMVLYDTTEWNLGDFEGDYVNALDWNDEKRRSLVEAFEHNWLIEGLDEDDEIIFDCDEDEDDDDETIFDCDEDEDDDDETGSE